MKFVYGVKPDFFLRVKDRREPFVLTIPFVPEHRSLFVEDAVQLWDGNEAVDFKINGIVFCSKEIAISSSSLGLEYAADVSNDVVTKFYLV